MATPYEKLLNELKDTDNIVKEVGLGRRIGYYKLRGILGKGAFSEVKLGHHVLLNEKVAIKIIEKGKHGVGSTLKMMRQEVGVMNKIDHPNILSLYEEIETLDKFYCILEHVDGSLKSYVKAHRQGGKCTITEDSARFFFIQILDAVEHMHQCGVFHRDLKTENILLDADNAIRVADFGISTCDKGILTQFCGSPAFCPPEILKQIPYKAAPMDVWAMGVILYELNAGRLPFNALRRGDLVTLICNIEYFMPEEFSKNLQDFIRKILVEAPEERLTLKKMRKHPWLLGAENDTHFNLDPSWYEDAVRDKMLELGIPNGLIQKAEESMKSGVEPRDSIHGTYKMALHKVQIDSLHKQVNSMGRRFSLHPSAHVLAANFKPPPPPRVASLHSLDSEDHRKKKCCAIM